MLSQCCGYVVMKGDKYLSGFRPGHDLVIWGEYSEDISEAIIYDYKRLAQRVMYKFQGTKIKKVEECQVREAEDAK